jgi:hypothetical protein
MKCIVILNVENHHRAPAHASIALPTYTSCFVAGDSKARKIAASPLAQKAAPAAVSTRQETT